MTKNGAKTAFSCTFDLTVSNRPFFKEAAMLNNYVVDAGHKLTP